MEVSTAKIMSSTSAHVVENHPDDPLVEKIILLQCTKNFGPRDVSKLPVYHRVFFGACAAIYVQQDLVVSDSTRPRMQHGKPLRDFHGTGQSQTKQRRKTVNRRVPLLENLTQEVFILGEIHIPRHCTV